MLLLAGQLTFRDKDPMVQRGVSVAQVAIVAEQVALHQHLDRGRAVVRRNTVPVEMLLSGVLGARFGVLFNRELLMGIFF
jgi:hypothetical protein